MPPVREVGIEYSVVECHVVFFFVMLYLICGCLTKRSFASLMPCLMLVDA